MIIDNPDIPESKFPYEILMRLLCDQSSKRNIIWATDDYAYLGEGFYFNQTIEIPLITGDFEGIIKPRSEKAKDVQNARSKDKAEVFTPSWICNKQNNLIDEQWFGRPNVFNTETENGWMCYLNGGRIATDRNLFDWAKEACDRGAGEILFTSMNHDGVKNGYANEALARLSDELTIPIIASGGAGKREHFRDTFLEGKSDAALAASVFHFGEIPIPELKKWLKEEGINVRL